MHSGSGGIRLSSLRRLQDPSMRVLSVCLSVGQFNIESIVGVKRGEILIDTQQKLGCAGRVWLVSPRLQ